MLLIILLINYFNKYYLNTYFHYKRYFRNMTFLLFYINFKNL